MKNAVVYARYSCDRQTEQSIEGQMRVCNEFAEQNGYNIIHCYIDRAVSGLNDNREEFQKMIKASADKEFEIVIVYKLDRFARNRYDSAVNKAVLKKNGVKVLSATEQITDTPEGVILEALLEGFAEYYSAELSQKVKRGIIESRKKGLFTGGTVNFGYKIVKKRWTIVDREARIIRKAFNYYSNGMRMKDICAKINKSKPMIEINRKIDIKVLAGMLRNKRYIGIIKGDKIYDNIVPAIVKKDIFQKVGEMLDENRHRGGHFCGKERYSLSGKLYCAYCGAKMTAASGTSKTTKIYRYYKCVNRNTQRICSTDLVSKEKTEKLVAEKIFRYINDEDIDGRIVKYYSDIKKSCSKNMYPKLKREKKQLIKTLDLFKPTDLNNAHQTYEMINALLHKAEYKDGAIRLYLSIMQIELEIVSI